MTKNMRKIQDIPIIMKLCCLCLGCGASPGNIFKYSYLPLAIEYDGVILSLLIPYIIKNPSRIIRPRLMIIPMPMKNPAAPYSWQPVSP